MSMTPCGCPHLKTLSRASDRSLPHQVHIAYVEIYKEDGFDLLDPAREGAVAGFGDLPRVGVLESDDGRLHMRNLSLHCATTEEEALNLVGMSDSAPCHERRRGRPNLGDNVSAP